MIKNIFAVFSIVLLAGVPGIARGASGATGAEFLKVNVSARSGALGGALSAAADSVLDTGQNPSALKSVEKQEIGLGYFGRGMGINFNQIGYARALEKSKMVLGLNLFYANYGDIEETRVSPGRDQGVRTGNSFDASDYYLSATFVKVLNDRFFTGGNVKVFNQKIADASAQGYAFDFGALYSFFNRPLNLALTVKNAGPSYKFKKNDEDLPLTFTGGVAARFFSKTVLVCIDVEKEKAESIKVKSGLEYAFKNSFFIRTGQSDWSDARENFAFGGGFRWKNFQLDYAIQPDVLAQTHRVSINAKL